MTQQELKEKYTALYDYMAVSRTPAYMKAFGNVMNEMMDWMIANKADAANEWIEKLSAIKWHNYLTPKEADKLIAEMVPKAPWSREQWKQAMEQHDYALEKEPFFNRCAMFVTMSMIYSDSIDTINKYIGEGDAFEMIHDLALDKLLDEDKRFSVRKYFEP